MQNLISQVAYEAEGVLVEYNITKYLGNLQVSLQTGSIFSCIIMVAFLKNITKENKIQQTAWPHLTTPVIQIILITVYWVERQDRTCDSTRDCCTRPTKVLDSKLL